MKTNAVPHYDDSYITTNCCPRFNPEGWDARELHFHDKRFVRALTRSLLHVPLDMGPVFARVRRSMEAYDAEDPDDHIVLSRDLSPFHAEHYFAARRDVPTERMARLSGDFVTRVFEGPYSRVRDWLRELRAISREHGRGDGRAFFFYTTCPRCAKTYGENYVVGLAEV